MGVQQVYAAVYELPFPQRGQYFARTYPQKYHGMAVAARSVYAQQVRLLHPQNRERARHDGRQSGEQEVLSDESEDLRAQVCHGLFLGLLQRHGKQKRDGACGLSRVCHGAGIGGRAESAEQLLYPCAVRRMNGAEPNVFFGSVIPMQKIRRGYAISEV